MILELHQQGLTVSAISRETGIDRKTVRKYIERGLEVPAYGPRKPRATVIDPFASYLRERVKTYPGLTGSRLLRELRDRGYAGGYTAVTDFLRDCDLRQIQVSKFASRHRQANRPKSISPSSMSFSPMSQ